MPRQDITSKLEKPEVDRSEAVAVGTGNSDKDRVMILDQLAEKITASFRERASARAGKELEWTKSRRLYDSPLRGEYDASNPDRPFSDETKGRRPIPNIVRTKCDAAIANSVSMQFAGGEKNWDLFPPPNTIEEAVTHACRLMEKEIETQLSYTKYAFEARRAMEDRVIYGTGILKGPVNTGKRRVAYINQGGEWIAQVSEDAYPCVKHVSTWRFYPDMSTTDWKECTDAIEVHPMTTIDLASYIDHPGFDGDTIKEILLGSDLREPQKADNYNEELLKLPAEVWARNPYLYKNRHLVLEYHGPVTYDQLNKLGLEPTYDSPTQEYYGEVWVCQGKVIRMELENIEGYSETPYCVSVWKRDPTSVFGFGHPLLLADTQQVITQVYHMILDNASLTSGPQIAMFQRYIQPVDGDWTIAPNKVWLLTDPSQSIDKAIQFFNPTNVIDKMMPVLQLAQMFADEESATNAIAAGLQSPQNTDTATGQLLMMHNSTTILDFLAEEWDDQVTEKLIRRMYAWNMQYSKRQDIKGDFIIDVKSSSEYKNKQMHIRDLERLSVEITQNPEMAMSINVDELTSARLALMHLPGNKIVKTKEEIAAAREEAANRPNPDMIKLQIESARAETERMKAQLEEAQLRFEVHQQQQREAWEHEERMSANYARVQEAQAQVLKARSEVQVKMLELATQDKQAYAALGVEKEMKELAVHSQVFLKSLEENRKTQELMLTQQELDLAKATGEGI